APAAPVLAAPSATHQFALANAQDDVVGDVQITIASKEDTLPDIARRFDVGYEEIVRANPGVDPWIPGAGHHIVVPTRSDNPQGKYEFRLGWRSYLIHGTNKPYGVGLRSSHGCVRLYPEDIEKLFELVPNGTQVRVVNQPFVFGWYDDQLYLQAYTVLEDDARDWKNAQKKLLSHSLPGRIQSTLF